MSVSTTTTTTTASTKLSGKALQSLVRGKSPQARARIAAAMTAQGVSVYDLSAAQNARLCEANAGAVSVALGHSGKRGPRRRTIDRVIRRYGADALMRGLDR